MRIPSNEQFPYPPQKNRELEARLEQIEALTGIDLLARYAHPKGREPNWKSTRLRVNWDEGQFKLGRVAYFGLGTKPVMAFNTAEITDYKIILHRSDFLSPIAHLLKIAMLISLVFSITEHLPGMPGYLGWGAAVLLSTIYLSATFSARHTVEPVIRLTFTSPSTQYTWVELRKKDFGRDFGLSTHLKSTRELGQRIADTLKKSGFRGEIPSELTDDPPWQVDRLPAYVSNGLIFGLVIIKLGIEMLPAIIQKALYWIERLFP